MSKNFKSDTSITIFTATTVVSSVMMENRRAERCIQHTARHAERLFILLNEFLFEIL